MPRSEWSQQNRHTSIFTRLRKQFETPTRTSVGKSRTFLEGDPMRNIRRYPNSWLIVLMSVAMIGAVACNSGNASKNSPDSSNAVAATSDDNGDSPINVMCIGEHINN